MNLKPAPAAFFFEKGEWAHRGRVLAVLTQKAIERGVTAGGEWLVLLLIARKVLGLTLAPTGRLNAQSIAETLGMSDRAAQMALHRLAGLMLIELERDGKEIVRCRIHPALFDAARDGQFLVAPVDPAPSTC